MFFVFILFMQLILLFLYALHFYVVTMHSENALLQFMVNLKKKQGGSIWPRRDLSLTNVCYTVPCWLNSLRLKVACNKNDTKWILFQVFFKKTHRSPKKPMKATIKLPCWKLHFLQTSLDLVLLMGKANVGKQEIFLSPDPSLKKITVIFYVNQNTRKLGKLNSFVWKKEFVLKGLHVSVLLRQNLKIKEKLCFLFFFSFLS